MPLYSYICPKKHEYDEVLSMADYQKETKCPKCGKVGEKVIVMRQNNPTFSDKIFPYYDRALNKVFNNRTERTSYLKKKGLSPDAGGRMTPKQERQMLSQWRVGGFDPSIARHSLRD